MFSVASLAFLIRHESQLGQLDTIKMVEISYIKKKDKTITIIFCESAKIVPKLVRDRIKK